MVKKKLLLFGATGMLGGELARSLAADFEVHAPTSAECDVLNAAAVAKLIAEIKPAIIVNATGYTAVDRAESDELAASNLNAAAVETLASAAKAADALFVHFSTDYVFDGKNANGYAENSQEFKPQNVYGRSKLAGEFAVLNSGCRFVLVRTSWVFGAKEPNFVATMLRLAGSRDELKVVADQHGCPSFAPDVAEAVRDILRAGATGIFHLTNAGATTWADFAREIFRQKNLPTKVLDVPTSAYPTPAARPQFSVLVNTRRPPLRKWEVALDEFLRSRNSILINNLN